MASAGTGPQPSDLGATQCAYRVVGARRHHRVPGCGIALTAFTSKVNSGEIEVLLVEPTDTLRCGRCYSDESYARHPL